MVKKHPNAFTLIEVTAVLVLIGLMASAAALSLRSAYRGSQMKDVISRITALDQSARRIAEMTGRAGVIRIDQPAGKISFSQEGGTHLGLLPVQLPNGYRIIGVHVASPDFSDGAERIACSANGLTQTYSIKLAGFNEQSRLLVFAGLSGQVTELESDADFSLDKLLTPRPDTH
ncbi:MAG: prepilin-type N-terminal cleavage/methylation domain-containing protein [Phycisphaerales bacterium]